MSKGTETRLHIVNIASYYNNYNEYFIIKLYSCFGLGLVLLSDYVNTSNGSFVIVMIVLIITW